MKRKYKLFIAAVLLICLAAGSLTVKGFAKTSVTEYRNQQASIKEKKAKLNSNKKKIMAQIQSDRVDVKEMEQLKNKNSQKYQELRAQEMAIAEESRQIQESIDQAQRDYDAKLTLLKERVKNSYENDSMSMIYILLGSKNLLDLTNRIEIVSRVLENDKKIMDEAATAKKDLVEQKAVKQAMQERKRLAKEAAEAQYRNYSEAERKLAIRLAESRQNIRNIETREDEMDRQSKLIDQQIQRALADAARTGHEPPPNSNSTLQYPVPYPKRITSGYGYRIHPILKYRKFHSGVDLGASYGAPIYAANGGTVLSAGWESGYGNTVVLNHGHGMTTLYAHCSSIKVSRGATVKRGQTIALVGSTGLATGPHLHFEVRINGATVNPANYI